MLEFESIHKWKTAVLYPRNCLVKFCRINDENLDFIGVFLSYIFFVASWWQRYKDSNLKWRIQRLAIFFRIAYLSHFSDFLSLKNLSEFCFRLTQQIRMRSCEPYTEVCRETLNPHYYLQQGTVQFDDEEYKKSLFNRI